MTIVSFLDLTGSFKLAFHEVLSEYFDGGVHSVFNNNLQFLQPKLNYDARVLADPPQGLTITIVGSQSNWLNDLKCQHPGPGASVQDHGVELRAEIFRTVFVTARIQEDDSGQNRKLADQCFSQLQLVISFARKDFADRGILLPQCQSIPHDVTADQNFAQAAGTLNCQVMAQYSRYNSN